MAGALPVGVEGVVEQRVDRIRFRCREGVRLCPAVQAEVRVSDDQMAY